MNALRHAVHRAGAPLRWALILAIRGYQATLSGWLGGQCRFSPTCSQYAIEAIERFGAVRGLVMATWRILRCNPYGKGGIDPVPGPRDPRDAYDDVIHEPSLETGIEGPRTGVGEAAKGSVA